MPRPVSSNEPIGLDPSAYHTAVISHLPPPTSSTPPPTLSSSLTQSSSPPPAGNAWWQWDELSALQPQSKDDLNLNMSVEYSLRRQRHTLLPAADYDTDGAPVGVFGFMDESMKNDGFVPIMFEERSSSAAAQSTAQPSATTAVDASPATASSSSASASSTALPSIGSTFQTIASVSAPSGGKPSSGLLEGESGEFVCPCCGVRTAGGMSYHGHVTQCYMSRFLNPSRSQPSTPRAESRTVAPAPVSPVLTSSSSATPGSPSAATIQSLRECVSQLGLHTRLSMMEAFFRLSRSTATAETTDTPQPFPVEEKLISLLYSPAPHAPSPPLTAASPTASVSTSSASPSYRYSPDIERPFSPSSYSSLPNELYPHTPAQSPPRSPHTPHTCLTPALHQWGVDEEKGESLTTCSLHDNAYQYTNDQGNYTSAPSSPSPAVKRARALSQPAIPYFDDLHTPASHYVSQPSLSMTSPTMRSYSPVQVHTHHYASPSASVSSSSSSATAHHSSLSSQLLAPVPISASRRHSTGNNRASRQLKSSKGLFQPVSQHQTPSTSGSSYIHTPRGTYDASSVLNVTDDTLSSPASSTGTETKSKRRRRESRTDGH